MTNEQSLKYCFDIDTAVLYKMTIKQVIDNMRDIEQDQRVCVNCPDPHILMCVYIPEKRKYIVEFDIIDDYNNSGVITSW